MAALVPGVPGDGLRYDGGPTNIDATDTGIPAARQAPGFSVDNLR